MSKTTTVTIAFLLARLAEDEAAAREAGADAMTGHRWKHAPEDVYGELQRTVLASSARILREVEAKRRVVEEHALHVGYQWPDKNADYCAACGVPDEYPTIWPCPTLRALASVYADHEDFDAGWAL